MGDLPGFFRKREEINRFGKCSKTKQQTINNMIVNYYCPALMALSALAYTACDAFSASFAPPAAAVRHRRDHRRHQDRRDGGVDVLDVVFVATATGTRTMMTTTTTKISSSSTALMMAGFPPPMMDGPGMGRPSMSRGGGGGRPVHSTQGDRTHITFLF